MAAICGEQTVSSRGLYRYDVTSCSGDGEYYDPSFMGEETKSQKNVLTCALAR